MMRERALHPEMFNALDLDAVRERMEKARERRLQPGYIAAFFLTAFARLGGRIRRRETGRYQIVKVPDRLITLARSENRWMPVAESYERVTFELDKVRVEGKATAALIAPGHPLLGAVIEATIADLGDALAAGTIMVDRREQQVPETTLLFTVEQRIRNASAQQNVVSHHFDYPLLTSDGTVTLSAAPPYLDFDAPRLEEREAIAEVLSAEWLRQDHERLVRAHSYRDGVQPRMAEVRERLRAEAARTRVQVKDRLLAEINHWDREYLRLQELERSGTFGRILAETARRRGIKLESRMTARLEELDRAGEVVAVPSVIRGKALVIPASLLSAEPRVFARDTAAVERRAVEAVCAAERACGRVPEEMPRNNPGYDIRSTDAAGRVFYIEVKGRIEGADTFTITANEVTFAQTQEDRHRLALVEVSTVGAEHDRCRYVTGAFTHIEPSATTRSYNEVWAEYWARGALPSER